MILSWSMLWCRIFMIQLCSFIDSLWANGEAFFFLLPYSRHCQDEHSSSRQVLAFVLCWSRLVAWKNVISMTCSSMLSRGVPAYNLHCSFEGWGSTSREWNPKTEHDDGQGSSHLSLSQWEIFSLWLFVLFSSEPLLVHITVLACISRHVMVQLISLCFAWLL